MTILTINCDFEVFTQPHVLRLRGEKNTYSHQMLCLVSKECVDLNLPFIGPLHYLP